MVVQVLVAIAALAVGAGIGYALANAVGQAPLKRRITELEKEIQDQQHPRRRTLREALSSMRKAVADLSESLKSGDFKNDENRALLFENAGPELKRHAAKLCRAKEMRQQYSELESERIAWFLYSAIDRSIQEQSTTELERRIWHLIEEGPEQVLNADEPVDKAWWRPYMPSHRITRVADLNQDE